jgi:spermidine synthase
VLIHGLGLGVVLNGCLLKPEVTQVTVVERSTDVIALVASHYQERFGDRFELIQGDAFTWKPEKGRRWSFAWHDVWDYICADNLPEMHKLHRRFGQRVNWQRSWCRSLCERYRG